MATQNLAMVIFAGLMFLGCLTYEVVATWFIMRKQPGEIVVLLRDHSWNKKVDLRTFASDRLDVLPGEVRRCLILLIIGITYLVYRTTEIVAGVITSNAEVDMLTISLLALGWSCCFMLLVDTHCKHRMIGVYRSFMGVETSSP